VTDVLEAPLDVDETLAELRSWLGAHWDPDLTVAEWWELLGTSGWAAPTLPTAAFGRGVARSVGVQIAREIAGFGALGAPDGLGVLLAAPTIADHGTPEQVDTLVRDIVTGQRAWCQLFSEPGAGSDLAGLTTRAEVDGDEWMVNGQKVWTSLAKDADLGMLIARSAPDLPKHKGITYFALDMHQPGVEVRPLREMTGHAMFNETFLTDARVSDSSVIGGRDNGWAVANTTLGYERAGLGSGGGGGQRGMLVTPGTVAGNLTRRVGDMVPDRPGRRPSSSAADARPTRRPGTHDLVIDQARRSGALADPVIRQDLVRLYVLNELGRMNGERLKAVRAAGGDVPGMANIAKLSMSAIMRLMRDVGLAAAGAQGMLHAYDSADQAVLDRATGNPMLAALTTASLYAQAPSIYGGTDQIQRNIIGERVLGLPREPGPDRDTPFSELARNT
jgi:alkylation response protein AidB-like acyl-CoA dehydrogenase